MKKKRILKKSEADRKNLVEMTDEEIDTTDIPEISPEKFAESVVRKGLEPRKTKAQLTIRLDRDVLEWFRRQGRGYQTKINDLLRAYMMANRKGASGKRIRGTGSKSERSHSDVP